MTINQLYELYRQYPSVQTDTRKLKEGDLFFALKGGNFNGNEFALQALQQGAAYAIIDETPALPHERLIQVDDVLHTLQQLALHHRQQFNIPVIAITGSNGKTTTKELVNAVLSSHYTTYTTQGNLNNHIGVPLTLLRIKADAQMAIVEMGANHLHEIESYCQYTLPTHGIITNCGKAHLEGFGDLNGVKKAKGELYDFIRANNGSVIAFDDYDYLHDMTKGIQHIFWYGTKNGTVVGNAIANSEATLQLSIQKGLHDTVINTQLVGDYNLPNVLCAIAVGNLLNVPGEKIKTAIENFTPDNSRSQMIIKGSNKIILDAYNANPSSMKLAIENFTHLQADKKIILIGGMMELGKNSVQEHQAIIDLLQQSQWHNVILVGGDFEKIASPYIYFNSSLEAKSWFESQHFDGAHILIKGSRGMQMERVLG